MMRPADKVVGVLCTLILLVLLLQMAYQTGFDRGRDFCRPPVQKEIKPMTHKQKVRWSVWATRDSGVILK